MSFEDCKVMDAIAWVEQGKQQLQWSLWSIALQSFERAIAIDSLNAAK